MNFNKVPDVQSQRGSTLIEVAISMLLFSTALLGIVGLQGMSIRLSEQSGDHSNASSLSNDLFARLHSNRAGLEAGNYSQSQLDAVGDSPTKNCVITTCNAKEVAEYDLWVWNTRFESSFSSDASVLLEFKGTENQQVSMSIVWTVPVATDEDGDGVEDRKQENCAKGDDRPANERAYCATANFSRM